MVLTNTLGMFGWLWCVLPAQSGSHTQSIGHQQNQESSLQPSLRHFTDEKWRMKESYKSSHLILKPASPGSNSSLVSGSRVLVTASYPHMVSPSPHKFPVLPSIGCELASLRLQIVTWSRQSHKFCSCSLREKRQFWGTEFYLFYLFTNEARFMLTLDCVLRCGAIQKLPSKRHMQASLLTNLFFYQPGGS